MSGIPPQVGRRIQQRIDMLDVADPRAWPVRVCKEQMNALPLHGNQIYLWALRADGVVLCLDHESSSHSVEAETDPLKVYAVLRKGAARYPELAELVLTRPPGARLCELCGGTGEEAGPPPVGECSRCNGFGWYQMSRPAADWANRIDRGDRLAVRTGAARELVAGRLAGYYVTADGNAYWSSPAGPAARQELIDRLQAWERGEMVTVRWEENPTAFADPFDSPDHAFIFYGLASGGSWEEDFARQPDGSYVLTETLNNDFDPAGPAFPRSSAGEVDAGTARAELERMMRSGGRRNPFPAIVPRE
jgi:hypothetical protein